MSVVQISQGETWPRKEQQLTSTGCQGSSDELKEHNFPGVPALFSWCALEVLDLKTRRDLDQVCKTALIFQKEGQAVSKGSTMATESCLFILWVVLWDVIQDCSIRGKYGWNAVKIREETKFYDFSFLSALQMWSWIQREGSTLSLSTG